MKTLKVIIVLIFTVSLFFSCDQEDNDFGTLIINAFGGGSNRAIKAEIDDKENKFESNFADNLKFIFECTNLGDKTKVVSGPYNIDVIYTDPIQLAAGNWDVYVKVLKEGQEIGSSKYPTVTIVAGQTTKLGGISVKIDGYQYGSAAARKVEKFDDYKDPDSSKWSNTPTIYIDRYLPVGSDGQPTSNTPKTENIYDRTVAHGNAKILWDGNALYVKVLVEGAAGYAKANPAGSEAHNTDSVEIFFNDGGITGTGYQNRIDYNGHKTYNKCEYDTLTNKYKTPAAYTPPAGFDLTIIKDDLDDGISYIVIAKIPLSSEKAKNGSVIGVDLQVNGVKINESTRSSIAVWYDGQVWDNPKKYATSLTLVE